MLHVLGLRAIVYLKGTFGDTIFKYKFYDVPYKVRCIKHLDVLTVVSDDEFIIVKCFSDPTDKTLTYLMHLTCRIRHLQMTMRKWDNAEVTKSWRIHVGIISIC